MYDPSATTWTFGPPVNMGRAFHTATLLPDGEVVLVGGYNGNGEPFQHRNPGREQRELDDDQPDERRASLSHLDFTDQRPGRWRIHSTLPTNTEVFNPATGNWSATAGALNQSRVTATLLANGRVLVTGGLGSSGDLASVELFDPVTGLWALTNPMHSVRSFHTATLLTSGQVLVAGGESPAPDGTAEIYDPVAGTWTLTGGLNTPRFQHVATLLTNGQSAGYRRI